MNLDNIIDVIVQQVQTKNFSNTNFLYLDADIIREVFTAAGDLLRDKGNYGEAKNCYVTANNGSRLFTLGMDLFHREDETQIGLGFECLYECKIKLPRKEKNTTFTPKLVIEMADYLMENEGDFSKLSNVFSYYYMKTDEVQKKIGDATQYLFDKGSILGGCILIENHGLPKPSEDTLLDYANTALEKGMFFDIISTYTLFEYEMPETLRFAILNKAEHDATLALKVGDCFNFFDSTQFYPRLRAVADNAFQECEYNGAFAIYSQLGERVTGSEFFNMGKEILESDDPFAQQGENFEIASKYLMAGTSRSNLLNENHLKKIADKYVRKFVDGLEPTDISTDTYPLAEMAYKMFGLEPDAGQLEYVKEFIESNERYDVLLIWNIDPTMALEYAYKSLETPKIISDPEKVSKIQRFFKLHEDQYGQDCCRLLLDCYDMKPKE